MLGTGICKGDIRVKPEYDIEEKKPEYDKKKVENDRRKIIPSLSALSQQSRDPRVALCLPGDDLEGKKLNITKESSRNGSFL